MQKLLLTAGLALSTPAIADDWPAPRRLDLSSPNGSWTAVLEPAKESPAAARLTGPDGAESVFVLRNDVSPVDALLLDGGTLVTFDQHGSLGLGEVLAVYDNTGKFRFARTLEELLPGVDLSTIPRSISSRSWRRTPLEAELVVGRHPTRVVVTLWNENKVSFDVVRGRSTIIAVDVVGTEPRRVLPRIEALSSEGKQEQALDLARDLAVANPHDIDVHYALAGLLADDPKALQTAVTAVVAHHRKTPPDGDAYNLANLMVRLANSHLATGDPATGEALLRDAMTVVPRYSHPVVTLAKLLKDRPADLDAMLSQWTAGEPFDIGDIYLSQGRYDKARDALLKGYDPNTVTHMHSYLLLADAHEKLGDTNAAIAVHEQLLAHYRSFGGNAWDSYIDRSEQALTRLRWH